MYRVIENIYNRDGGRFIVSNIDPSKKYSRFADAYAAAVDYAYAMAGRVVVVDSIIVVVDGDDGEGNHTYVYSVEKI